MVCCGGAAVGTAVLCFGGVLWQRGGALAVGMVWWCDAMVMVWCGVCDDCVVMVLWWCCVCVCVWGGGDGVVLWGVVWWRAVVACCGGGAVAWCCGDGVIL
jgi:hypothetical protein